MVSVIDEMVTEWIGMDIDRAENLIAECKLNFRITMMVLFFGTLMAGALAIIVMVGTGSTESLWITVSVIGLILLDSGICFYLVFSMLKLKAETQLKIAMDYWEYEGDIEYNGDRYDIVSADDEDHR